MRRSDKKISESKIIQEILTKSNICRLAFFDENYPYIVPLNFGYKDNALYFHCALEGKKLDLIKKNNKVAFEIEQSHEIIKDEVSCKWTTKYRSIIGNGKIYIISDKNEKIRGLNIIMQQHGKHDNIYNKNAVKNVFVLKLEIENLTAKQSGKWE